MKSEGEGIAKKETRVSERAIDRKERKKEITSLISVS